MNIINYIMEQIQNLSLNDTIYNPGTILTENWAEIMANDTAFLWPHLTRFMENKLMVSLRGKLALGWASRKVGITRPKTPTFAWFGSVLGSPHAIPHDAKEVSCDRCRHVGGGRAGRLFVLGVRRAGNTIAHGQAVRFARWLRRLPGRLSGRPAPRVVYPARLSFLCDPAGLLPPARPHPSWRRLR